MLMMIPLIMLVIMKIEVKMLIVIPGASECVDIDECLVANGGCQHDCHNTEGGHRCSCRFKQGYYGNGRTHTVAMTSDITIIITIEAADIMVMMTIMMEITEVVGLSCLIPVCVEISTSAQGLLTIVINGINVMEDRP